MKTIKMKSVLIILFLAVTINVFAQENIALNKPVTVSSEASGFPASKIVDGKISRTSKWEAGNGKAPHIVEIDLRKYYAITELRVHSGITDAEKKADEMNQAAGFWSVKNFKMQYWDDANWSDFPKSEIHENRQTTVVFNFNPAVTTFRIRLVCDDGEPINIMEIEAFGKLAANMPEPPTVSSSVKSAVVSGPKDVTVTVTPKVTGKTMKYVGYNQGYYMPGSNVSAWVEYSQVNSFRVWATLNSFVPQTAVDVDKNLTTVEEFDKRKNKLREDPENNAYIKWPSLTPLYDLPDSSSTNAMVFNYALTELKRLKVDVVLQMGSQDFDSTWSNKWKQWQRYYALAYYAAKKGDVSMFAMQNEPNHRNSGPMKLDQWIGGMQIVSDAVHCAIADVNKKYGKALVAKFVGPVTAGQNTDWWAGVSKNVRTDYHGNTVDKDLLEIFSTHSYNSPAVGYESRINNIREIIKSNHPKGDAFPIVYTEIGRWMNAYLIDKEETMDSPSLFSEWAGIYANNMKNGGYGMWAFKFANTTSGPYPRGIKSGHHFIWQGQRIVEDAYTNLAKGKPVKVSSADKQAKFITDGNKSDQSAWIADSTAAEQWAEIDLGKSVTLGSAVIYTGSDGGVYTAPDRVKNFKLQYYSANTWLDIPGMTEKDNKYAQVFETFKQPVTTNRVRFVATGKGSIKVREIKLFAAGDGPSVKPSYDVSGIQRTGEVVRLFAKGFKDERPLLETKASVDDSGLDTYTSYDEASGNYYMWLVQRGTFEYNLKLDLSALEIDANVPVTVESVGPTTYGEVIKSFRLSEDKEINLSLFPNTVFLITLPKRKVSGKTIPAVGATVAAGKNASKVFTNQKQLTVRLDAGTPDNNQVAYLSFDFTGLNLATAKKLCLKVHGYTDRTDAPFRLHVYGIPDVDWKADKINWNNAPLLDDKEALVQEVGTKAFVAGELAFTTEAKGHMLDVTELMKKHAGKKITFVLVRETRQLGDDEDKGKKVMIDNSSSTNKSPALIIW